jgi:multidrug efflux pump subunit AcrA (membrane-fusion protein)
LGQARVDGQIVDAPFRDGQDVVKGQTLFQIDARPLQALLKQAQANLARDKAQLERARAQEIATGSAREELRVAGCIRPVPHQCRNRQKLP